MTYLGDLKHCVTMELAKLDHVSLHAQLIMVTSSKHCVTNELAKLDHMSLHARLILVTSSTA